MEANSPGGAPATSSLNYQTDRDAVPNQPDWNNISPPTFTGRK